LAPYDRETCRNPYSAERPAPGVSLELRGIGGGPIFHNRYSHSGGAASPLPRPREARRPIYRKRTLCDSSSSGRSPLLLSRNPSLTPAAPPFRLRPHGNASAGLKSGHVNAVDNNNTTRRPWRGAVTVNRDRYRSARTVCINVPIRASRAEASEGGHACVHQGAAAGRTLMPV
jgi:hypothetical protein